MDRIVKTQVKNIQVSPQKARLVANLVRKMSVTQALDTLQFLRKKAAVHIRKALMTAVSNAKELYGAEKENLEISKLMIDEGLKYKRVRFASRGRVSRLNKRRSHINLELRVK